MACTMVGIRVGIEVELSFLADIHYISEGWKPHVTRLVLEPKHLYMYMYMHAKSFNRRGKDTMLQLNQADAREDVKSAAGSMHIGARR